LQPDEYFEICPDCIKFMENRGMRTCVGCGRAVHEYEELVNGVCNYCKFPEDEGEPKTEVVSYEEYEGNYKKEDL
jgi:NMD protein affecting ribosome stability and mRNA decay